jgi:hypothetical protein
MAIVRNVHCASYYTVHSPKSSIYFRYLIALTRRLVFRTLGSEKWIVDETFFAPSVIALDENGTGIESANRGLTPDCN